MAAALYWIGVTTWAVHARITNGVELWYWPLVLLAAPHLWFLARRDRYQARVGWLVWVLALCASVGTGASLTDHLSDYWIVIYASFFTVLWLTGRHWFADATGRWQKPLQTTGALGMMVLALILTFKWPWHDLVWHWQWRIAAEAPPLFWLRLAVVALWPVAAMCLWGVSLRRRDIAGAVGGVMPVLAALGFVLGDHAERDFAMPLLFDVYLLAVGVATVVAGVRDKRLGVVNGGMLVLAVLIIARFFDSDLDFLVRGLAFVAVGVGFLVTNLFLLKRTKVVAQ